MDVVPKSLERGKGPRYMTWRRQSLEPVELRGHSAVLSANSVSQVSASKWTWTPFQHWRTNGELALGHVRLPALAWMLAMG